MMAFGESKLAEPTLRHVTTTIEIDAPPERVYPNVVGFFDLPAPPQWIYCLGIADPLRALISGVGAVRHCELSTGPFVGAHHGVGRAEASRVRRDVAAAVDDGAEPLPEREGVAPRGLHGLEGRRVPPGAAPERSHPPRRNDPYTLAIYPELYWVVYAEALRHGIHGRVLEPIKNLSASTRTSRAGDSTNGPER